VLLRQNFYANREEQGHKKYRGPIRAGMAMMRTPLTVHCIAAKKTERGPLSILITPKNLFSGPE
jgi:hypothetical protein